MPASEDLVAHVRERRVVVVGAGAAGLVAAWECARVGLTVIVLDAADHVGGSLALSEIDGLAVDGAYTDFAADDPDDPAVTTVLRLLGCAETDEVPPARTALAGVGAAPAEGILGIPTNPWDPDVRRIVGWPGTWRAYLDRLRPPMTIGREPRLGALVQGRLGPRIATRIVAPLARARWESAPHELDADAVIPGISTALTRAGSLTGAVAQVLAEPAPARRIPRGGFGPLLAALETQARDLGVDIRLGTTATRIARSGDQWRIEVGAASLDEGAADPAEPVDADAVVIATGPADALRLLTPVVPGLEETGTAPEVNVVTLVLDVSAPLGAETVAFPEGSQALSVTDVTALSPRLSEAAGPGRQVVRVVLAGAAATDAEALARATASIADATGAALAPTRVRGHARARRVATGTGRRVGDPERVAAVRTAIGAHEGLYAVGGWIAGGDLSEVIGDAVHTAERVRHDLLWGADPASNTV